jgi:hypothetical protein
MISLATSKGASKGDPTNKHGEKKTRGITIDLEASLSSCDHVLLQHLCGIRFD